VADKWQQEERLLQNRMKKKLGDIRAVFKGDERQMIINTYYRQMGYSPLSALKSSVGLLLQIPFFIAAYQFLSHTPTLAGESFWVLKNLGAGDGLLHMGSAAVNVLPVIMTAVNIISALVYTKDLGRREKVQLFGMALLFLVLLYNSPSGLVLYWTCNNIFSLGKNIAAARLKHPARALQGLTAVFALILIIGAISGAFDVDRYTFVFIAMGLCLLLGPFLWKAFIKGMDRIPLTTGDCGALYFSSAALLCLILGLLIPLLIWSFANTRLRKVFALGSSILTLLALICLFALSASYGLISRSFKIEDTQLIINAFPLWVNPAALLTALVVPVLFFLFKKLKILSTIYQATALAVLIMALINWEPSIPKDGNWKK
jgi:YidC/Oxa1 family membrane protein insertase